MAGAAEARRAVAQLARIGLDVGDQLLRRVRRHRRMHDQDVRRGGDEDDRHEILGRVVGQLGSQMRQDRLRAVEAHVERIAVGRGFRGRVGADQAAAAGAVLDHHRLALLAELGRKRRATMSATPPGASDTMILIGCDGYCCALAGAAAMNAAASATASARKIARTIESCMASPQTMQRPVSHAETGRDCSGLLAQCASTASSSSATMLVILIIGFTAGPAVSL